MIDIKSIAELYKEMSEVYVNDRGCVRMMLNRKTVEVWNDFFVSSEDYKIYDDESIVAIPVSSIIDDASDHILTHAEIAEEIVKWIENELETWKFKSLLSRSSMNMKQFSEYFGIPYRTVQDWKRGVSKCPEYLLNLIQYKLEKEEIID